MENKFMNLLPLTCKVSTHRNSSAAIQKLKSTNSKWELSSKIFTLNKYGGPPVIEVPISTQMPKVALY